MPPLKRSQKIAQKSYKDRCDWMNLAVDSKIKKMKQCEIALCTKFEVQTSISAE